MKKYLVIFVLFVTFPVFAQEKTDWYYVEHLEEILPDARAYFEQGDYEKAIDLCALHMGNTEEGNKDEKEIARLHDLIVKCMDLAELIDDCIADGRDLLEVHAAAEELRILNPSDKRLHLYDEAVKSAQPKNITPVEKHSYSRLVTKLGVSFFGVGKNELTFAPEVGVGLYNIGGSRLGIEAKGFLNTALNQSATSIYGGDIRVAFRIGQRLYPSVGVGFFNCDDKAGKAVRSISGLFVPVSLSLILGRGMTLEAGVSIFPEVKLLTGFKTEQNWYGVPDYRDVVTSVIVPKISIGYAF